jgi:aminoglycoside phosphotransferase (APT) family kinase protein
MRFSKHEFPELQFLTKEINNILGENDSGNGQVIILNREPNSLASTFPSEIISCRLSDGSELQLFCKYSAGFSHNSFGHRGDLSYEIDVYRQVLKNLEIPSPMFYGAYQDEAAGEAWIFLQYFEEDLHVKVSIYHTSMHAAARWLGQFHLEGEAFLRKESIPFLKRHDSNYYCGWADRTSSFANHLHKSYPWLETICKEFREVVYDLLEPSCTIIHGEYYPNNVLYYKEQIYPVDWESAAIATGEIDLASLTDNWSEKIRLECISEYQSARWPEGPPAEFERTFETAQLYWHFRWLGERPEWTTHENERWRFEEMQQLGEQLGMI